MLFRSKQPHVAHGSVITFDGGLDNRNDLRLVLDGQEHRAAGDAELALAIWRVHGIDGLGRLVGDFSLVIFDIEHQEIVLASDAMGTRPLYYGLTPEGVIWSTLLKQLVEWVKPNDLDEAYAAGFFQRGGCRGRTPYAGICSVPPGQAVVVSQDGVQMHAFWRPPVESYVRYQRYSDYEERLRELFEMAVARRMDSDFPVLFHLSGGMDSSSIVCMAKDLLGREAFGPSRVVTLSIERQGSLDKHFYELVGKWCGFEGLFLSGSELPYIAEDHTGDALPAYWEELDVATAQAAREIGVRTIVTGSLGDMVMGNVWDDSCQIADLIGTGRIGASLRQALKWSLELRRPIGGVLWRNLLMTLPAGMMRSRVDLYRNGQSSRVHREDSLTPAFRARTEGRDHFSEEWMQARPSRRKHIRALTEYLELRRLQPAEPLTEFYYTHPFAHRPLVEFMMSIPPNVVCGPGEPRRLMRSAFRHFWPPELRYRRSKDSFAETFLSGLRPLLPGLLDRVGQLQVVKRGIVEPESLRVRLAQVGHGLECNVEQLRRLILLELWLKRSRLAVP